MAFSGDEQGDPTDHTSGPGRGYRTDLRSPEEDGPWLPDKVDIRQTASYLASGRGTGAPCPIGTTAFQLSKFAECSKEWARQILLEMVEDGTMRLHDTGHFHLFFLVVPEVTVSKAPRN